VATSESCRPSAFWAIATYRRFSSPGAILFIILSITRLLDPKWQQAYQSFPPDPCTAPARHHLHHDPKSPRCPLPAGTSAMRTQLRCLPPCLLLNEWIPLLKSSLSLINHRPCLLLWDLFCGQFLLTLVGLVILVVCLGFSIMMMIIDLSWTY